jgi:hypothetical protein
MLGTPLNWNTDSKSDNGEAVGANQGRRTNEELR